MTAEEFSKTPMYGKKLIRYSHSSKQDMKNTNPNFDKSRKTEQYNSNCQRCVFTYEARRRGYDVEALPISVDKNGKVDKTDIVLNHWSEVLKNAKFEREPQDKKYSPYKFIADKAREYGDGSRSVVCVIWPKVEGKEQTGHVFIVENQGGRIVYIDPQTGLECPGYLSIAERGRTMIFRVDNLEFSDYIKQCCKNRR